MNKLKVYKLSLAGFTTTPVDFDVQWVVASCQIVERSMQFCFRLSRPDTCGAPLKPL